MAYYPPTGDYVPPDQSYHRQNEETTRAVNTAGNTFDPHTTLTQPQAAPVIRGRTPGPRWDRIALLTVSVAISIAIAALGVINLTGRQHASVTPCGTACAQKTGAVATSAPTTGASATPTHAIATTAPTQPAAAALPFTCGAAPFAPYQAAGAPFPASLPGNPLVTAQGTLTNGALTLTYDTCVANTAANDWQLRLAQQLQSAGWTLVTAQITGSTCHFICATQQSGPTPQDTTLHIDVAALQTQGTTLAAILRFSIPSSYASNIAFSQTNTTMSATPGTLTDLIAQGQDRVFTGARTTILVLTASAPPTACGLNPSATFRSYPSTGQPLTVNEGATTCLKASSGSLALVQFDYTGIYGTVGTTPNAAGSIQWWVFPIGFGTTQG